MSRKKVVRLCAICETPTPNRRNLYCVACRDDLRALGRMRAVEANKLLAQRRKEESGVNRDLQKEIDLAREAARVKFEWWHVGPAPTGRAICAVVLSDC